MIFASSCLDNGGCKTDIAMDNFTMMVIYVVVNCLDFDDCDALK